jgi:hypothetical protein
MCHNVADICVQAATSRVDFAFYPRLMLSPREFIGTKHLIDDHPEYLEFTEEMARWIEPGLNWIKERHIVFFEAEQWLDLTSYLGLDPETGRPQGGYLDMGWIETNSTGEHTCVIFDWKFGQEPVSVERNLQLILYAVGFYQKHKDWFEGRNVRNFRLVIEQPRVEGGGDSYFISLENVLEIANWLAIRAAMVTTNADHRLAGVKQCRWCEAKNHNCHAYDGLMLQALGAKMPDIMEPKAEKPKFFKMTPEARGYLLKHKTEIVAWLERLHADAIDDAMRGLPTPGNKLVKGRRSPRAWIDETRAVSFLYGLWRGHRIDDTHTHKLLSPTQTADEIGDKVFAKEAEGLWRQSDGKPILVDEDDPKPALALLVDRMPDVSE